MPNEPPTLGEIVRLIERMDRDIHKLRDQGVLQSDYRSARKDDRERIEDTKTNLIERISSLKTDLIERLAKLNTDLTKEITEIQESLKWARRASVGGLIFPLMVVVVTAVLLGR